MAKASKLSEVRGNGFFSSLQADLDSVNTSNYITAYAVERLRSRCRKRYQVDRPELRAKAEVAFVDINDAVGAVSIRLPSDVLANAREFILHALWRASTSLGSPFPQDTLYTPALYDLWSFGPGASVATSGTHTAEKLYQAMSVTEGCRNLVKTLRFNNRYLRCYDAIGCGGYTLVEGSKLGFVPKNEETVRTIATEPSGNMAMQLAAGRYLERALQLIGIDLSDQPMKNRTLCKAGELFYLSTIDLKSASDMISIDLVEQLFPAEWFKLLLAIRSPYTRLPSGELLKLNMISTMGNGTTFPLMTLIIVSLIYAYRARNTRSPTLRVDWSRTAVFGDDIIIPSQEYDICSDTLTAAGFIINHDKSFRDGPFRESCGLDAYSGVDVTPFYAKNLATSSDIYVVINQCVSWSIKHQVPLPRSLRYLFDLLPNKRPFLVPEWEDPSSGVLTSGCPVNYKLLKPRHSRRILKDERLLMPLACGGFVTGGASNVYYVPRSNRPRYVVANRRLPRGWLTGWDPLLRSQEETRYARLVIGIS